MSYFWDKGVPAFLSKRRKPNLTCKGFCGQWKPSSVADPQMYKPCTQGQSYRASPHTSAAQCQCPLWLSLTPGVQGAQCDPHAPPTAARDTCDNTKITSGTAEGRVGCCCPNVGREHSRIWPGQGTGLSLHSVWAESALLSSTPQFTTQKNEAWKCLLLSSSFLPRGAVIRREKAADRDGLGRCSLLSVNAGSGKAGGASFAPLEC